MVDKDILQTSPDSQLRAGLFLEVPYMTGTVRAEFGMYVSYKHNFNLIAV